MEAVKSQFIASKQNNTDIKLLPYVCINGEYTLPDYVIHGFYDEIQKDGIAQTVFQNGNIQSGDDLLQLLKAQKNLPAFAFIDNKIVGLAWLNNVSGKHAFGHFAFCKAIWGKYTEEVGKAFFQYWFSIPGFNSAHLFDVILGFVPAHNKHALEFIKRLGMTQVGTIPSMCYNAGNNEYQSGVLSYIERSGMR